VGRHTGCQLNRPCLLGRFLEGSIHKFGLT
jgi:hypothetical protein